MSSDSSKREPAQTHKAVVSPVPPSVANSTGVPHSVALQSDSNIPIVSWNPWLGLIYAIGLFIGSQFIGGIALVLGYSILTVRKPQVALNDINGSIGGRFLLVLLIEVIVVGGIVLFIRNRKSSLASIGLKKPQWSDLGYGLIAAPAYYVAYAITLGITTHLLPNLNVNQTQDTGFGAASGTVSLILTFISLVILPPIAEEILVRGFIYSNFKKAVRPIFAVLLTSALFASAHLTGGVNNTFIWVAVIDTFVLSLFLIYLREKTGSLWASMFLHATKNGVAFLFLFLIHTR
jgi:membrane protease YdiL (CAAX protease family)